MKKFYLAILAMAFVFCAQAQLTGTKNIPGDYATIAAAVTDLNAQGPGAGGVTFNVLAGHTESVTSEILITTAGASGSPILFQKLGAGANPKVTRTDAGSNATTTMGGLGDGIIKINATDYITFDGIDVQSNDQGIEYGYYINKISALDASQNVTIKNSVITMTKGTSGSVVGILIGNGSTSLSSATGVTVTANSGRSENITITGNTIQNVHSGVYCRGSSAAAFYDQNFVIGDVGAGNTIVNYGGGAASSAYGIYFIYTNNVTTNNNTIDNAGSGGSAHGSTLYGVFYSTISGELQANSNNITLSNSTTSAVSWFNNGTNTTSNSTYTGNTFSGTITSTSASYLIYNNNTSAGIITVNNNSVAGSISKTGASGSLTGYYNNSSPTGTENIFDNNFSNISVTGTSTFIGIQSTTAAAHTHNIYNNIISNITGGTGTITGIITTFAETRNIYNNSIHTITSSGPIIGISSGSGFVSGGIYKNKVYNLTSNSTSTTNPVISGILISGGTAPVVYNNLVGDFNTPTAAATDAIRGISVTSTTGTSTVGIYYNSVYINATSTGANFGTSALYATTSTTATTAALDIRNNIFVNLSTAAGTGLTVAYRRSSTSLTNYSSASDNNLFYAGVPSASNLIFYDGTNADQTLIAFKARVAPREANSISENPPFLSTTGSAVNFLHLNTTIATSIESGGQPIAGITTDFDGDTRNATTPDIGADEFTGTPLPLCNGTPASGSISGATSVCSGLGTNLSLTGGPTTLGITYEWQTSSTPGGPYTTIPGATTAVLSTGPLTQPAYYVVIVSCSNSGLSSPTAEFAVGVNALPVVSINPSAPAVCLGGNVALTASGASTYAWTPSTNLSGTTGATVTSTPTVTRTYTVTGTDGNGCVDTETVTVTVNPAVTATSSAAATNVCLNGSTQLNAVGVTANYSATAIPHSPIATPGTGVTTLIENGAAVTAFTSGNADDGRWNSIAIPFTFKYYGNDFTAINISTNGYATFGTLSTTQGFDVTLPNTSTPNNAIHLVTSDLDFRAPLAGTTNAAINYFVDGVAPNRKFVINFKEVRFFHVDSTTGPDANPGTASVQAILYEGSNVIEIHTTEISNTTVPKAQGIENSAGTVATVVPDRNNTTTWTGAPNAYRFEQSALTYSWSPSALLNNANIANPVASNIATTTTFTVTVTDPVTGCSGTSSVTINVGDPLTLTTTASSNSICNGSDVTLSSTPGGGGAPYSYSWSNGTSVVSTAASFTATPATTTTYTLTVTDNCGQTTTSSQVISVVNPTVTATTPAARCGYGSVALGATGSAGTTLNWYSVPTGGTSLGSGTTFNTPAIGATTSYYVEATMPNGASYNTGRLAPAGTTSTNLTTYGQAFTTTSPFVLNSVDVVSTTGTSITIALYNASGTTQLFTTGPVTVPANSTTPVNLGWTIAPGTYRIMAIGMTGNFVRENSGITYPITLAGVGQIDGFVSSLTGTVTTSASYYFMYNWNVTAICYSPRTEVVATVNTPPAVTVSATNSTICVGQSTTLSANSANAGYTYTWNPGNLSGGSVAVSPTATTKYYLSATDASGGANNGCAVLDSITITVNNVPEQVSVTPATASVCPGGTPVALNASVAAGNIAVGTGTATNGTTGYPAPYSQYYGGVKHQMLIRASELYALGLQAGDNINSLTFTVNAVGASFTGTLVDFQIDMGHTTNNVLTSSAFIGGLTNVFGPVNQAIPTTGLPQDVTHNLSSGFTWNGTDNIVVQTSFSNNISGTSVFYVQMPFSDAGFVSSNWYRADGATSAAILAAATPTSSSVNRTNMKLTYTNQANITWSPQAGLFTDAAGTVAYTGGTATTVYARPTATTTFTATATSPNNCSTSATSTVTVNDATVIGTQPTAQTACSGANASFTVAATGSGTLTYQWKKDGNDITGATSATYTINGVVAGDAGNYSVVVTGACGAVTSNAVALTVSGSIQIGTQPVAQSACVGGNAAFTVAATGSGTLTYQWKKDGNDITGATAATLNINGVAAGDAGNYSVVVTGTCGSVTSNAVALTVDASTVITTQPTAQAVCAGTNATFTVAATGTGTLTYQWKKDGNDIAGATSTTLNINGVVAGDAASYSVVVTGTCGSVTSNAVALTLNAATVIGTQPTAQAVCAGANATFTVAATGAGTLTYQWKKDGNDISGATSATYTINGVAAGDAANYSVVVTGTCGSVTSNAVALTLNAATVIGTQPVAQTVCAGANASFTVSATGQGTLTYQWKKDGNDISGATSDTYTINGVAAGDAGNYSVVVTGACGSVTSNAVALTLNASTVIGTQPVAQAVCAGANASFTVAATGQGTLTYQWKKGGTDIPGATSATYAITGAVAADAANYSVVVTGSCGSVTSNAVALTVNAGTTITTQPAAVTTCLQQSATFTVVAAGTGTLTYQWKKDGTDIPGATSASYIVNNIVAASAGNYNVVVTGGCGSVTSANAALTVSGPCTSIPTIGEEVTSAVLLPNVVNNSTTLRVTALRSARIQWNVVDMNGKVVMSFSNQVIAGKNDFQLRLAHLAGGNYYLVGSTEKGKIATIRFVRM